MTRTRPAVRHVVFDLDGVIRHYDPEQLVGVESRHGLEPGTLWQAAFHTDLGHQLITGRLSRADWTAQIGSLVDNLDAAREWLSAPAEADPAMVEIIETLRERGTTVSVLTNGSDTVPAELDALDLRRHLDHLFNTAAIGVAKPDPAIYHHVVAELDASPNEIFFTDDSPRNVTGAISIGMRATLFTGTEPIRRRLISLGLIPRGD